MPDSESAIPHARNDEIDREYGRENMDASDVDGTLYDIRSAIEAARRGEIDDAGLQDAASDVEAVRGWVQAQEGSE